MDIYQAGEPLVCTNRIAGLQHISLHILRDKKGNQHIAVDPVGINKGNWVFTSSGSAARFASGDFKVLTDLTVCGIIDYWEEEDY